MEIFLIISIVIFFRETLNQNNTTQVCYGSKSSHEFTIIFSISNGYSLPHELELSVRITEGYLTTLMYRTIYKRSEPCNKSYELMGPPDYVSYLIYEFTLMRNKGIPFSPNSVDISKYTNFHPQILDKYIVEVFKSTNDISAILKGIYGENSMKVEFGSSKQDMYLLNMRKKNSKKSYSSKLTSYHTCLFLQHDKLWMSIPIQQLSDEDYKKLYNTSNIRFTFTIYIDIKILKSTVVVYNSWVNPCQKAGSFKLDLVVKEKIDRSHLEITFFDEHVVPFGTNNYYYSPTENKFIILEKSFINIRTSVTSLDKAIKNPRNTHIYLDNFDIKSVNCNYNRGIAVNHKVSQFGIVRYHTYLIPSIETPIDGIIPWRPLNEDTFLEKIENGTLQCRYDK